MSDSDKDRLLGIIATVILHALFVVTLVTAKLCYDSSQNQEDVKQEEILFGGDYVVLGDFDTPVNDAPGMEQVEQAVEQPAVSGEDIADAGPVGETPAPAVTSDAESPMKVQEEKNPGPSAEEIAAEQERVRKQEEAKKKINKRVSFGKTDGTGQGTSGSPDGAVNARLASGAPGVSGLDGYTLSSWGKPSSSVNGVVRIRVRVNSRGKVIEAKYESGSGSAASNVTVRRSCEQAALKSQFSVPKNTTTEGVGVITWRFE